MSQVKFIHIATFFGVYLFFFRCLKWMRIESRLPAARSSWPIAKEDAVTGQADCMSGEMSECQYLYEGSITIVLCPDYHTFPSGRQQQIPLWSRHLSALVVNQLLVYN